MRQSARNKRCQVGLILGVLALGAISVEGGESLAQDTTTFTTLHSFDGSDGSSPLAALVQATNGDLFGTTQFGGANNSGTIFSVNPSGAEKTLYNFCSKSNCTDGEQPFAGLVQGVDGNFYGSTRLGGMSSCTDPISASGCGTVFKMTPGGTLTTLYSFCSQANCADGQQSESTLVQASNGELYGTASYGGIECYSGSGFGCGTIFEITPRGSLTTLHTFEGTDGAYPYAGLIQATNGNFYGPIQYGGVYGAGTVSKITPTGNLSTLYNFCSQTNCTDGSILLGGLTQAPNGNFYGTTWSGGASSYGTVFTITQSGALTTLHSFDYTDGDGPYAALVQATDGDFYGTTYEGGSNTNSACPSGCGTIFKITPAGVLTTLYNFCSQGGTSCTDGSIPFAGLVQDTNGKLYGTTSQGGAFGPGTVFSLSVGLAPFVKTQPTSGKLGAAVKILGTNLTGATGVTFNGAAATFTVVSSSEITTTVPAGATTGKVKVVAPHGTLSSNVNFRVL